jgi:hypothetical protein
MEAWARVGGSPTAESRATSSLNYIAFSSPLSALGGKFTVDS